MSRYNEDLDYLIRYVDISEEELNEIIVEADKIISDADGAENKLIDAYLKKVQCLQKLNKYVESKEFVDKLLNFNPKMPEAHARLGNYYNEIKEYDNAIKSVTKAIYLRKEYAYAYCMRGFFKSKKSNKKALQDYLTAIYYEKDFALAYAYSGYAKALSGDTEGAIEDYTKAIDIKSKYNYALAYANRGFIRMKLKKYKEAAKDFKKAEIDIFKVLFNYEKTAKYMLDDDDFFKEATEKDKHEKEKIEYYKKIYIQSLKIISKLHIKDEIEMPVSHYTKKEISEKLLFIDHPKIGDIQDSFHLNSVNTSNDPEEGKTLFHYLFPKKDISPLSDEFGAFAGCFILNNDSLNQFRLYGKAEDKEEGTGLSIALNEKFFNKEICRPVNMKQEVKNEQRENSPSPLPLFRCIYIDPKADIVVSLGQKEEYVFHREKRQTKYRKYKKDMVALQGDISKKLKALKKQVKREGLDHDIMYKLLLNLRYLVKHAAFKEEQECRIIQIEKLNNKKKVKSDENHRLYVKYLNLSKENISEICFAPKAKGIDKFKQHLTRNNYELKCDKSTAPLA